MALNHAPKPAPRTSHHSMARARNTSGFFGYLSSFFSTAEDKLSSDLQSATGYHRARCGISGDASAVWSSVSAETCAYHSRARSFAGFMYNAHQRRCHGYQMVRDLSRGNDRARVECVGKAAVYHWETYLLDRNAGA
uniref:Uncharacterized protein n=1 Tax=Haptolina brevifila TaxID=156173 RepID=A0A7S2MH04_9EUKA|mmetsp:Transcript_52064/g.103603  ORF Transcript_52064/g.103603 Transcript_52064/m.103603 type:complete len:137 (+) Transcript_52064:464-874(+)